MSSIGSNAEDLVLNADGSTSGIKLKIDGVEKASISSAGAFTSTTIDATKLTGALPAISAASLTNVPAANITGTLPAIDGSNLTGVSSEILKVTTADPSNYSSTVAYNSSSLTPCAQITVTATKANSNFLLTWSAEYGRDSSGRSQFLIADAYTAGTAITTTGNLMYSHYGIYQPNDSRIMTSYTFFDISQSLAVDSTVTYYWFLGAINAGTDTANYQRVQVMEVAG